MFEDLSRLIDHQIYLATQTCLRSLQGQNDNPVGSSSRSSRRPPEPAAAAAAVTSGGTWNRRPAVSSSSSSSTPTPWTASRTASQHHRDIQGTQHGRRDGGGREEGGLPGAREPGGTTSRFAPLGSCFLSPALSRIVGIQEDDGLVEGFENLRLGGGGGSSSSSSSRYYDTAEEEEEEERMMARRRIISPTRAGEEEEQQEARNDKTGRPRGVEPVANPTIPHDPKMTTTPVGARQGRQGAASSPPAAWRSSSSSSNSTKMTTTTETPPLKPLPQPWGARGTTGTGTMGTTTIAADNTHGQQQGSPRSPRVVQIPRRRPSPRPGVVVVEGLTSPLAQHPARGGAWRGNTSSPAVPGDDSNNNSNVFPTTDRDQVARPFQQTSPQAPRSSTSNTRPMMTAAAAAQVPRVGPPPPQEPSFQPTARQQQGQQPRRRSAEEEEEDSSDDSSQLSNPPNTTLLVPDVSQLKHFYERVFGVAPVHEDRVSATFPFQQGRLGVMLMEYHPSPPQHSNTQGAAASSMRDAPLGRHRDVGLSVRVEDIEQVWDRLRMLEEGKGKGKEGDHRNEGDGLPFGGVGGDGGWDESTQAEPCLV